MSEGKLQQLWDSQTASVQRDGDHESARSALRQFRLAAGKERRNAVLSTVLAIICGLWIGAWAMLFIVRGAAELREADLFPPLWFAFVIPAYIAALCMLVAVGFVRRRKEYDRLMQSGGLQQGLEATRIQVRRRLLVWKSVPVIWGAGIVVGAIGAFVSPDFNPIQGKPLPLVMASFIPDCLILVCLWFWARSVIRRYRPQLDDLDSFLSELRNFGE